MKIYKKIVYDKDMKVIEEDSYDYKGPITKAGGIIDDILGGIGDLIGGIIGGIGGIIGGVIGAIGGMFGFSPELPDFGMDEGVGAEQMIQGVLVNKAGAIANIPIIYGTRMVGGTRVFVSTDGDSNKHLYVAFILCEGQTASPAITKLLIDDNDVEIGSLTHGDEVNPTDSRYKDRALFQYFDGRDNQISSTLLGGTPNWTSEHKLSGIAYLACRFQWNKITTQAEADSNPYTGGVPNIKVIMQGKKVYDATTLGSTHTTAYANETTTYTDNPVSCLLDYMRNSRFGKGLSNDAFTWATWNTAADLCAQQISFTDGGANESAFTCNAVADSSISLMSNIKIMLSGFRGIMPYTQGKYKLMIEHAGDDSNITSTSTPSTVMTVTNDNIIGGMSLEGESKANKINRCIVTYVDPGADDNPSYQPNQAVYPTEGSTDDIAYLAEDNGIRLEKTVTLPTIAHREQALQFAEVFLKRSRKAKALSFATTIATSNLTVGDLITIVNEHLSINGIFRITNMTVDKSGAMGISCLEHTPSNYAVIGKPQATERPETHPPDDDDPFAGFRSVMTLTNYSKPDNSMHGIGIRWTDSGDPYVETQGDPSGQYRIAVKKTSQGDSEWLEIAVGRYEHTKYVFWWDGDLGSSYDFRLYEIPIKGKTVLAHELTGHTLTKTTITTEEQ